MDPPKLGFKISRTSKVCKTMAFSASFRGFVLRCYRFLGAQVTLKPISPTLRIYHIGESRGSLEGCIFWGVLGGLGKH